MAGEGIQQCQHHMQLLSPEQPFSPAVTTEREAELVNMVTVRKERSHQATAADILPLTTSGVCLHFYKDLSWLREKS